MPPKPTSTATPQPDTTPSAPNAGRGRGNRRQYTDSDKAAALVALEANGGNVKLTARQLGLPRQTLALWAQNKHISADVPNIQHQKRDELLTLFMDEIQAALDLMASKRHEASYRDLVRAVGIFTDKYQLLSGAATDRSERNITVSLAKFLQEVDAAAVGDALDSD